MVFAVLLIIYFFPEIKKDLQLLEKVEIRWLAIAICSQLLTYLFAALVYHALLKEYPAHSMPRLGELIKATVISLFFNQTVPSGGISGNTFIFRFLKRFNIPVTDILALIIIEMLCYYAALEILIIGSLIGFFLFVRATPHIIPITLAAGIGIFLLLSIGMLMVGRKKFLAGIYRRISRIKFIREKLSGSFLQTGIHGSVIQKQPKKHIITAILFQLLMIFADSFTVYALFRGLGYSIQGFIVLLAFLCTRIISILPVSPGALILYESSMVFFLHSLGIPLGTSIVVTLIYRLLSFWLPMPVGFILFRSEQRKYAMAYSDREEENDASAEVASS
ncbi:hypothetical protein CLV59_104134 [Chitinophaga dinghuensis]|uniref:Lysylphosphatidylglycerol synthase-like protein n=2 Tax=Chitinophaga dinghuensis TaxID=1539050 RepID=A0A327VY70_9BACT|nr:hypothetical protein CLV59_104134 [Chitinophaga dinghuensis]